MDTASISRSLSLPSSLPPSLQLRRRNRADSIQPHCTHTTCCRCRVLVGVKGESSPSIICAPQACYVCVCVCVCVCVFVCVRVNIYRRACEEAAEDTRNPSPPLPRDLCVSSSHVQKRWRGGGLGATHSTSASASASTPSPSPPPWPWPWPWPSAAHSTSTPSLLDGRCSVSLALPHAPPACFLFGTYSLPPPPPPPSPAGPPPASKPAEYY